MISIEPFISQHLEDIDQKAVFDTYPDLHDNILSQHASETSFVNSLVWQGEVMAVFGGTVIWPGVMYVNAVTSNLVNKCGLEFTKGTLRIINMYQETLNLWRMQMDVLAEYEEGCRWALTLGFKCEGLMKQFGPARQDAFMYARVF